MDDFVHRCSASALPSLIAPLPVSDFLSTGWRKRHCHVPGVPTKFSELLTWQHLNRILEQHRLEPPRLKLLKGGEALPAAEFIDYRERNGIVSPEVATRRLNRHLRNGASLVLNQIDSLHQPLTSISEDLERLFGLPVGINAYVGFGDVHGMGAHCDKHEVFILQVEGRKRWVLYGKSDSGGVLDEKPPGNVIWESCLNPGDCLYIPRGCWHVVIPMNEPSIHLTVGIINPTVVDIMDWLVNDLRPTEFGYRDVSRLDAPEERQRFEDSIRERIKELLAGNLVERYFLVSDAARTPKTHVSLPWSVLPPERLAKTDLRYRLTGRRAISFENDSTGTAEFSHNGSRWRYPAGVRSLLTVLNGGDGYSLAELKLCMSGAFGEDEIAVLLSMLIADGLVSTIDYA
jgi:hypothetical protein